MSALDDIIRVYGENVDDSEWVTDARAELAQLHSTIESWIALWKYICHATNCEGYLPNEQNFDSMLDHAPRYVSLRATVAEQERRLAEAANIMATVSLEADPEIANPIVRRYAIDMCDAWLAANTAPDEAQ